MRKSIGLLAGQDKAALFGARKCCLCVSTRHLIELGGLVVKADIAELTGDDRAMIFGALLWCADKLKSDRGERARALWAAKGRQAFEADLATRKGADRTAPAVRR